MTKQLLQHPCWGKRHLYSAERLAVMDAEYTAAVEKYDAEQRVKDEEKLERLKAILADGTFHHATYRYDFAPGWYIYVKDPNGFRGFSLIDGISFAKSSHLISEVEKLVRNTGYSVGSYGNG